MPTEINYPIKFHQSDLQRYVYTNKNVARKLIHQLKSIENVATSCTDGVCRGLSHTFIAYEKQGLGAHYINLLKLSKNSFTTMESPYDEIKSPINQLNIEYNPILENVLNYLCTDIFNLQINQSYYNYYYNMANKLYSFTLPPRPENSTHFDYIFHCLEKFKNDRSIYFSSRCNINFEIEKELIKDFYTKIESNAEMPVSGNSEKMTPIYNKIRHKKNLTPYEIQVVIEAAYNYCYLHYASETASTNVNLGVSPDSDQSAFSFNNIYHRKRTVTLEDLKNDITGCITKKQDFSCIFSTTDHAMAITYRYDMLKNCYIFSFFEPNKGLIQTESKKEFFDILTKIPTYNGYKRKFNPLFIGYIRNFQKSNTPSKKLHLPVIIDKGHLTKKHLVNSKTVIKLNKGVKLSFEGYYQENDELTLKLQLGKRTFTIYSELNDINKTVDLINYSMQEFPNYMGNDIYIDWKGQILNRLSKY